MHIIRRAALALALCGAAAAHAADSGADTAKAQYEAEKARCNAGQTGQDQASCLRSAGAAYDAIRQNRLQDANTAYKDNALSRCKSLPAAERTDCESRVDGQGTSSGSVRGGGVIKETVTPVPNPPAK